jgi:hypothetical protein
MITIYSLDLRYDEVSIIAAMTIQSAQFANSLIGSQVLAAPIALRARVSMLDTKHHRISIVGKPDDVHICSAISALDCTPNVAIKAQKMCTKRYPQHQGKGDCLWLPVRLVNFRHPSRA